jgi:tRNA nucleotidyltransferase (CCA-adding enzyme)
VDTFKPLLKGTDLAKALGTKPGPWMKEALDVVMAWQLRNPNSTDAAVAIEAVKALQGKETDSELPSRLASHFLQLTIPPFFPQNKSTANVLEASRELAPWKEPGAQYALDLLKWSIGVLSRKEIEGKWHLLVPPILKMIDDMDAAWKAKGCHYLGLLLESFHATATSHAVPRKTSMKQIPSDFLHRTGYHNVFAEALFPMFTYIPLLTPETEAVTLFNELFPAVTSLALLGPVEKSKGDAKNQLLDKILREGVLSPLAHFTTPSTYPELATIIVTQLQTLLGHMGIESVKHLPSIIPLLSTVLQEPFIVSHRALTVSTLKASQAIMQNAWPRIPGHRGAIMMGLSLCWARCIDEDVSTQQHVKEVKLALQDTVAMLDGAMQASSTEQWEAEKRKLVEASPSHLELFERCEPGSA